MKIRHILALLFFMFCTTIFAQGRDYINEMEQNDLQIRQKPNTEGLLSDYLHSANIKEDTIFAILYIITAKPKAHAFKNEMCFPLTKTKCELKKHPNSKFECFFNDFNRTKTSLFLPFPSKLIQDNLVCVLELQE